MRSNADIDREISTLESRKAKLERLAMLQSQVAELEHRFLLAGGEEQDNLRMITKAVSEHYSLPILLLISKCREPRVAYPRQLVFYLARELSGMRPSQLARLFKVDHGTVSYAFSSVVDRMSINPNYAEQVQSIKAAIANEYFARQ